MRSDPPPVPVEERQDPAHRLQPRCASRELLPRPRALVERRRFPRRSVRTFHYQRPVPTTGTRARSQAHTHGRRGQGRGVAEAREFLGEVYPKLFAWHQYLATARDPEGSGLVTIYHPWESGTDNSPRWTSALERVEVEEIPDYERLDLDHIPDPAERPTGYEYDRFIWLVEVVKHASCDDAVLHRTSPFLAKDVLASAILVRANEALLDVADVAGAPEEEGTMIRAWIERGREGLEKRWDPELGLCLDYDLRAGEPLAARTIAGFAPLIAGTGRADRLEILLKVFESHAFTGNPELRRPLPPSSSPDDGRLQSPQLLAGSCLARDELALVVVSGELGTK